DWGHARDYVRAMWLMLQQDHADDYVIATGRTASVAAFADMAFGVVGLNAADYIRTDEKLMRPAEVELLLGDPSKAAGTLGWKAEVTLEQLAAEMVEADLVRIKKGM
ncbi:MAG: GDP-mannose 4,6-dehydratase, partial [Acidiphilium sp.]